MIEVGDLVKFKGSRSPRGQGIWLVMCIENSKLYKAEDVVTLMKGSSRWKVYGSHLLMKISSCR